MAWLDYLSIRKWFRKNRVGNLGQDIRLVPEKELLLAC